MIPSHIIELLGKILYLSNVDHCEDSDDLQNHLRKIEKLIQTEIPDLEESDYYSWN